MNQITVSESPLQSVSARRLLRPLMAVQVACVGALSLFTGLPIWVALAGWLSYYTRGSKLRDGAYNLACVVTGLGIGIVAHAAADSWYPGLGVLSLPAALLLAASIVWLMDIVTGIHNLPSYVIGIAVVFVADATASLEAYLMLTAAVTVGAFVGALSDLICRKRRDAGIAGGSEHV